jgi:hypothetical protein
MVELDKMAGDVEQMEALIRDINNLLTVILGNASLARASVPDYCLAQIYLDEIEAASQRMAEVCQTLAPSLTTSGTDQYPG